MKRNKRKKKRNVKNFVICTNDELMLDRKREKSEFLSNGVAISQATIEKSREDELEVEGMKKELEFLRKKVNYYK
jgi:hypothetical protein